MATKKTIKAKVKFRVPAGGATPAPPVGSTLGQHGLNMMDFINPFNEATRELGGQTLSVDVTVYEDKTFDWSYKLTPTADLIMKAAGLEKGSGTPNKDKVGKLSKDQINAIAETKMKDLNAGDLEHAAKIVAGTARSMGVEIE